MTSDIELTWYAEDEEGCWNFTGTEHATGYGYTRGHEYAHRYFYARMVGEIPAGMVIDHLCMNKFCVNPQHLEPVTQGENARRWHRSHAPFTHCHNGHEKAVDGVMPNGRCRRCHREKTARYRASKKEQAA